MTDYLEAHKRIKKEIDEQIKDGPCACIYVNGIAEKLGMDVRTVKTHLELMKVHGYGTYLDDKEQVFCTVNGVEKLREQVKKKMEEE